MAINQLSVLQRPDTAYTNNEPKAAQQVIARLVTPNSPGNGQFPTSMLTRLLGANLQPTVSRLWTESPSSQATSVAFRVPGVGCYPLAGHLERVEEHPNYPQALVQACREFGL